MKRALLISTLSLTAAACASTYEGSLPPPPPPPVEQPAPGPAFDRQQFAWSTKPGTAQIKGAVSYAPGYSCAGGKVVLTPDAPYSRQRIRNLYGSVDHAAAPVSEVRGRQKARAGEDYSQFVRTADCGADNRFSFRDLPAGGWFIIVAASQEGGEGEPVALLRRVVLKKGEIRAVTMQ
jgi:hypothetical protein